MREEFDKEFDALLRRTAARAGARGGAIGQAPDAPHLDADELSAFAEGALPPAARAASVAHLADCARCRRAAAGLASAAGVAAELDRRAGVAASAELASETPARPAAEKTASPPGWRSWLAALFAPRVVRYAAPAVALCLVVVTYVALRPAGTGDSPGLVARRAEEPERVAPGGALMNANTPPGTGAAPAGMSASSSNMNAAVVADSERPSPAGAGGPPTHVPGVADAARPSPGAGPEEGRRGGEEADARADEVTPAPAGGALSARLVEAPAPSSVAAPVSEQVTVAGDESKKEDVAEARDVGQRAARSDEMSGANQANQARNLENQQTPDGSRNQSRQPQNLGNFRNEPLPPAEREAGAKTKAAPAPPKAAARSRSAGGGAGRAVEKSADDDKMETRAVEGRRFRRQNGVWVDTDYRDSLPSVGVRRGTEAYRALAAELPEVVRAAERLGGEVVVVARGRAYRIKP